MTEPTDRIDVVEDTELPRRLKDRVYEVAEERNADDDQIAQIAEAVEERYIETRVDPLDPVGTVSAQSIGEPGTQMSLPSDERIVVRRDGETAVTEIGPFVDSLLERTETHTIGDHEVALAPEGLEVPSLGNDERVRWMTVEEISRHETPDELLEFELKSGRTIRATKAHSFVTRRENEVVPVAGENLEQGDWLPIVGSLDVDGGTETIDIREHLPSSDYWYTSALTDGGLEAESTPAGQDQLQNQREALKAGSLDDATVYPRQGTVGLPERFPLDRVTGFFVGAWLAEGHATDHYVSVSNTDGAFQRQIRAFAERFGLSINEYDRDGEYGESHDIRVDGTVLADFLRSACTESGEKIVPGFAYGASDEFVAGVLRGYFSGDGNVGRRSIRSSSTSDRLTTGIALLLARFDISPTLGRQDDSRTLQVPAKYVGRFADQVGMVGERRDRLDELVEEVDVDGPDATDQIPNFGDSLQSVASDAGIPSRQVNAASKRQRMGRNRLEKIVDTAEAAAVDSPELADLRRAVDGDVVWDRIDSVETITSDHEYVYDLSVEGLETFTTADGVVTHNTMNTFHYAGVAEIDVTQGLPRLIELVDARKTPDTPMMTVHLEDEHATDSDLAHEVVWNIEATKILALGDVSTNVADMLVQISLNEDTLKERWPPEDGESEPEQVKRAVDDIRETIESKLGVTVTPVEDTTLEFGPEEPSYRELLQLVEELRELVFKGIEDVSRVVIRKEEIDDQERVEELGSDEEFVLYTEGSAFGKALDIEGVDASRTTCNNIHEIHRQLGIEAAREAIIEETMNTLEEQGLDDVNIRHLMLVADIMTNRGEIQSIGRHGISGSKESVLARAAFEVTVNHLLDAAVHGEVDDLNGVTENVIVGKPIKLGTGDVDLRMGANRSGAESADD